MSRFAWGAKVSQEFRNKVADIAKDLNTDPNFLMACMAFESGRTFRADVQNAAGSGARGLIQFMPSTAAALGTTTALLSEMTPVEQLDVVKKYFAHQKHLQTLSDVYMAILWPAACGKPDSYVLFDKNDHDHPKRYVQNAGLDLNHNGQVTKGEAAAKVQALLLEGLEDKNCA